MAIGFVGVQAVQVDRVLEGLVVSLLATACALLAKQIL